MANWKDIQVGDNLRGKQIHFPYPTGFYELPTSAQTINILKTAEPNSKYITGRDEIVPGIEDGGSYNIDTNILIEALYTSMSIFQGYGWLKPNEFTPIEVEEYYTFDDSQDYIVEEVNSYYGCIPQWYDDAPEPVPETPGIQGLAYGEDSVQFLTTKTKQWPGSLHVKGNVSVSGEVTNELKLVSFTDGTDKEIIKMLNAYYNGEIELSDYWHIGDIRTMHLKAMDSGEGASESHVEQDMQMVIIGMNHDTLKEPINDKTKAAITLQCKELLGNNGIIEGGFPFGTEGAGTGLEYAQNPRRTWFNETFINALPNEIQSAVKIVIKKNLANYTDNTAGTSTEDKAFFTSYTEMFGNVAYAYYINGVKPNNEEGEQYPYYNSNALRTKYINNNGIASSEYYYWLRSPSSDRRDFLIRVYRDGTEDADGNIRDYGIAPAFCL